MPVWPTLGDASLLRGTVHIHDGVDRLVLSQGPSLLLRVAVYVMVFCELFGGVAWLHMLFGSQSQRLVCDRAAGTCELNGHSLVPLAEVAGVELRKDHVFKQGDYFMVTLRLRDGTHKDASFQGAQSERSIAEYRASVDAVRAFLADPAQPRVDTTFAYRASWQENVRMTFSVVFFLPFVLIALLLWSTDSYSIDRTAGTVTATTRPLVLRNTTQTARLDDVSSLIDRREKWGRALDLQRKDGTAIQVAAGRALPEPLAAGLEKVLGKPVERR